MSDPKPVQPAVARWDKSDPARPPGRSPMRLLVTFVVALGVVLLVAGAVAVALTPPPPAPDCPDTGGVCGGPPEQPTLPPASLTGGVPPATQPPVVTPVPTATPAPVTPEPTAEPTIEPTPEPTPEPTTEPSAEPTAEPSESAPPSPTPVPTAEPTAEPTPSPTPANAFVLPVPRPASDAAPYRAGALWRSTEFGFTFEYDDDIWTVNKESPRGVQLLAARGNVSLSIGAFPAADTSPGDLFEDEVERLEGVILGFTEEPDPFLQLPGLPNVGYRLGNGGAFAGTVNSPQGPTVNVSIALLTAGDDRITVLVSLVTTTQLRAPAFSVTDSILNTFRWEDPEG